MPSPDVDIVFVLDASGSMQPCFDQLRANLEEVIQPLNGFSSRIRFGFVAQSVGRTDSCHEYSHTSGSGFDPLDVLYGDQVSKAEKARLFTEDPARFTGWLEKIRPHGDEDMLVALDVAADFPFGPLKKTKRVIALFSDEPFEGGASGSSRNVRIPDLIKKLALRRIQLYVAIPESEASLELASLDQADVTFVNTLDGLKDVDFSGLLRQMGKSISASSFQAEEESVFQAALFGQDKWINTRAVGPVTYVDKQSTS